MITIGNVEIHRVEENTQQVPLTLIGAPEKMITANLDWLVPDFYSPETGEYTMMYQSWLVRINGLNILVDPCNGNGRHRSVFPHFHLINQPYLERFESTGVKPEQVDIVFCTHLHCDHCGWNTQLRDGRWIPTFPNARYLFVRREVDRWGDLRGSNPHIEYNAGVYEESVKPVIEAGLAELVDDHHTISENLKIEPAYGHTAGHSILQMTSLDQTVYFTGDVFHHPMQILKPELDLGGGDNLQGAIDTRYTLRQRIADEGAFFLPAHFPPPYGGRIVCKNGEFSFIPRTWSR